MNNSTKTALLTLATIFPVYCFAQTEATGIYFKSETMSVFNFIILLTSLISIKQFFFWGETNYSPFHLINIVLIIIFYSIDLNFLIGNKQEFIGYEHLTAMGCITKFFISLDLDSLKQWVIIFGMVINVCYIVRKSRSII